MIDIVFLRVMKPSREVFYKFKLVCNEFSLSTKLVIQDFVSEISLYNFLSARPNFLNGLAMAIFESYYNTHTPDYELDPDKRSSGILFTRKVLSLMKSDTSSKESAYNLIIDEWYTTIQLSGANESFLLKRNLAIKPTKDFLILCDLFRCIPQKLLNFFVQKVVSSVEEDSLDNPFISFMVALSDHYVLVKELDKRKIRYEARF